MGWLITTSPCLAAPARTASRSALPIRCSSATVMAIPQRLWRPTSIIPIRRRERSTSIRSGRNGLLVPRRASPRHLCDHKLSECAPYDVQVKCGPGQYWQDRRSANDAAEHRRCAERQPYSLEILRWRFQCQWNVPPRVFVREVLEEWRVAVLQIDGKTRHGLQDPRPHRCGSGILEAEK